MYSRCEAQELSCDWFSVERLQESPQPAGETQATLRRAEKDASAAGSREDQHRGQQDAAVVPAARLQGAVSLHGVVEPSGWFWRVGCVGATLGYYHTKLENIHGHLEPKDSLCFNKTCDVVDILLTEQPFSD